MKKRTAAVLTAVIVAALSSLYAFAALPLPKAGVGAGFYVLDNSNVISEQAEAELCKDAAALEREAGAQLVLVTVDFLGGEEIIAYAERLFEAWQIGTPEKNTGFLLLLVTGEEDYLALFGGGFEGYLAQGEISSLLEKNLEADFAAGEYEQGARKAFGAIKEKLLQVCEKKQSDELLAEEKKAAELAEAATAARRFKNRVLLIIAVLIFALAVIIALVLKIRADNLRRKKVREQRRKKRGGNSAIDYAGRGRDTDNSDMFM